MKLLLFILTLLISIGTSAQLTGFEKMLKADVSIGVLTISDFAVMAYLQKKTRKDRERIIKWFETETKTNPSSRNKITLLRLRGEYAKSIGNFSESKKLFSDAINLFENSNLTIKKSDLKGTGSSVLEVYNDIAELYLDLGNLEMSKDFFEKSNNLKLIHSKDGDEIFISTMSGIAAIKMEEKDYTGAIELNQKIYKSILRPGVRLESDSFFKVFYNLGTIYFEQGDFKKASKYFSLARNNSAVQGSYSGNTRNLLNRSLAEARLSQTELKIGNISKAQSWIEKSENTFISRYSKELNEYTVILKIKSAISMINRSFSVAIINLEEMMDNHIQFLNTNFYSLSEIEKEKFFNTVSSDLNLYFDLTINIYRETNDPDILRNIINRRIQTKGFILNDQNKIKQAIIQGGDTKLKNELENWQQSKEALAFYLFEEPDSPTIDSLNRVINNLERSLSEKTRLLSSSNQNVRGKDIANLLGTETTAVEIIRYTSEDDDLVRYAAIIMEKGNSIYRLVVNELDEEDESRFSKYYKSAIQYETIDENTYPSLWKSIDSELNYANTVLLSPDGIYHQININTLPSPSGDGYLIDKYQVINMTNLKDIVNRAPENYNQTAYLFGRPQYDYTQEVANYFNIDGDMTLRSNLFMELENFQEQKFADLPGTEAEVKSISGTLENYQWATQSFTGAVATEQKVKSIQGAGILHIATHGFFLEASGNVNPMIKSGLVMAGVNNDGATQDDGVLTAYEATNLKLDNTWLVVLSACETGLGDVKNGEGVYGLQRALTVAGASNLMMTLWKVDDTATKELMINFYDQLGKGIVLEEAFRNSQIQLREKYPNPKYWGSFVLVKAKG